MTLHDVIPLTLRYFNEFAKPVFERITGSSSIELIHQRLASVTHHALKSVCVTKFTHLQWNEFRHYLLVTCRLSFNLSFKFCFAGGLTGSLIDPRVWRPCFINVCLPYPPLDNISVMVIVWRLRGNIIRTAPCWVV